MTSRLILSIALAILTACGFAPVAQAQSQSPSTSTEGLNALSDDAMLNELAARGLESLLDYAFVSQKVPPEKQAGIRTIIALRKLSDPSSKLTPAQRQTLIGEIVKGIDGALPSMRDPRLMLRQASDLLSAGVERDVNTIEYWGENPRTQGQLRPVVQTVARLLERCVEQANADAEEAANRIKSPDDKLAVQRYEQLEQLAKEAEYTKYMTDYDLVLAIDKADPQRKEIAGKAIEFLKQYDTADQPIRARVRNRIGKLALTINDLGTARAMFDSVIKPSNANDFKPAPDLSQQYEARYFRAVSDLYAQKSDEALKNLESLETWQQANLPNPDTLANLDAKARAQAAQEGASAAAAMLRYRILSQQADLAASADAKKKYNDNAVSVLYALLKAQPSLQPIIYDQLMAKLPADAPLHGLDVLLLQALVRRGETEVRRTSGPLDAKSLERGLSAANELIARSKSIDPQIVETASLLVGFFLDKLERDFEAAGAFLDFVTKHAASPNAELAIDNAQGLIAQLRRDQRDDPQTAALYERFLPVAIAPPFNRKQFAYEYARRLQLQGKPRQAIEYFRQVPQEDRRLLSARFFQTIALQQLLDELKPNDPSRAALAAEIQQLATDVNQSIGKALAGATSDEEKNNYRSMLVRTTLLAAEMARVEQNDPAKALALLSNFEEQIRGLPDAGRRMTDALLVRVQALMSMNQYTQATAELVKLLDGSTEVGGSHEPARGGRIVYDLLQRLNDELDKAEASGNTDLVRTIARNRAQLTGFLVEWARNNPNPAIKKFSYSYAVFDAEVQRFAAVHESDAASREAGLKRALDLFVKLNGPDEVIQYKSTLPPDPGNETITYDPSVVLGMARTQFDLGMYDDSRKGFSRLLSDRRLGPPVTVVDDHGSQREVDNDNYWEAVYLLIRCNVSLGSGVEESKNYLKQQLIRWGDRVGGKKWKPDFARLRSELIPDYDPTTTPTTQAGS